MMKDNLGWTTLSHQSCKDSEMLAACVMDNQLTILHSYVVDMVHVYQLMLVVVMIVTMDYNVNTMTLAASTIRI
jgi:hypothetical protein